MTPYVVDASVAAKWFLDEEHSEHARRLLSNDVTLCAPDFLMLELDNTFSKHIRRGGLNAADADKARSQLRGIPIAYVPAAVLRDEAFGLAAQTSLGYYDCLYLTLAVALRTQFVTADHKFLASLHPSPLSKHVLWVRDAPGR